MKSNKSQTYLLPLLSELVDLDKKYFKFIKNTYIYIEGYENCIALLHDFSFRNPDFTAYEHKLVKNELFVDLIDIEDQVFYIFKFPEVYLHEYNCFKEGKFSAFGVDAKELILEFYNHIYKRNPNATSFLLKVNQVLFKDKKLKNQIEDELNVRLDDNAELSTLPDEDAETFDISKYTKIEK
jgi:hypothetical protein